ncbi:MAG: tetratricopeptide repeat protein [Planctomycetes bacterium]|nr:tetratricopeptide repeat protein [Planctomycetota bacterium]
MRVSLQTVARRFGVALLSVALLGPAAARAGLPAIDAYNIGRYHTANGDFGSAIRAYSDALRMSPNYPAAYLARARAYLKCGQPHLAFDDLNTAAKLMPRSAEILAVRGQALASMQRPQEALADLSQAIALDGRAAEAYLRRSQVYAALGKLELVDADLKKALAIDPFIEQREMSAHVVTASHDTDVTTPSPLPAVPRHASAVPNHPELAAAPYPTTGDPAARSETPVRSARQDATYTPRAGLELPKATRTTAGIKPDFAVPELAHQESPAALTPVITPPPASPVVVTTKPQLVPVVRSPVVASNSAADGVAAERASSSSPAPSSAMVLMPPTSVPIVIEDAPSEPRSQVSTAITPVVVEPRQVAGHKHKPNLLPTRGQHVSPGATPTMIEAQAPEERSRQCLARGLELARQENWAGACAEFTAAIALNPKLADAHGHRGWCYLRAGRARPALEDFSSQLRFDPESTDAHFGRAQAYAELGQFDSALADARQARRIDPAFTDATTLCQELEEMLATAESAPAATPAGALATDDPVHSTTAEQLAALPHKPSANITADQYCARGSADLNAGMPDRSIANYGVALQLDPNLDEALLGRGRAYLALRRYREALIDFDAAIAQSPSAVHLYCVRAEAFFACHALDQACEDLQTALRLGPQSAAALELQERLVQARAQFPAAETTEPEENATASVIVAAPPSGPVTSISDDEVNTPPLESTPTSEEQVAVAPATVTPLESPAPSTSRRDKPAPPPAPTTSRKKLGQTLLNLFRSDELPIASPDAAPASTAAANQPRATTNANRAAVQQANALESLSTPTGAPPRAQSGKISEPAVRLATGLSEPRELAYAVPAVNDGDDPATTFSDARVPATTTSDTYDSMSDLTAHLDRYPQDVDVLRERGICYRAQGKYTEAMKDLTLAIKLAPGDVRNHLARAAVYSDEGRLADERDDLTEALRLLPDCHDALIRRGMNSLYQQANPAAFADFDRVIRQHPGNAQAWYGRGLAYAGQGQHERAINDLSEAVRLDPTLDAAADKLQQLRESPGR